MDDIAELEHVLLDTKDGVFSHPTDVRLAAASKLEGLQGLGVIGMYWCLRGAGAFTSDDSVAERLTEVHNREFKKYDSVLAEDFIERIAEEVLGRHPGYDEQLPENEYERIYSTFHGLFYPPMVMGRIDSC